MTWKSKDLTKKQFGNLIIIGDTGKRNSNGNKIYLARDIESGELVEGVSRHFINGERTGYRGSQKHKFVSGEIIRKVRLSLDEKQEIQRTIKAKITSYKKSKGYYYDKSRKKWTSSIMIGRKKKHLGRYETEQQAIEARQKAVDEQIKILEKQLEEL
ncbi:hypothetical protein BUZ44_02310 [Staphylococcus haemolyticus]|uniref:AP2 domain-containing protein n=1 Tax=Staphylococcus haemolyticus TaxID=1283 RepID=UPI000D1F39AF|nr:AP2 domain-containing protein [Staphylococcus haemolyticus]PTK52068.1 hypothetical protein BUZ44_02025 [Staphylococcus haemolyticus]PTK52118.1 hypothetical protein BUZ44_02310 [Staphylococcus haemolyticus]